PRAPRRQPGAHRARGGGRADVGALVRRRRVDPAGARPGRRLSGLARRRRPNRPRSGGRRTTMTPVDAWVIWLIVAAALAVVEVATLALVSGLVALAAVVAAVVALFAPVAVQVLAFILVAVGLVALVRPVAQRHLRTPIAMRTGT